MDKALLQKVRHYCQELVVLEPKVKAVWIYGSSTNKTFENGSDIDILVLVDDTLDKNDKIAAKVGIFTRIISEKAAKVGLHLHFQPPKLLTLWWSLLKEKEPWTITSLRSPIIIHDPSDYIQLLSTLLERGTLFSDKERAEKRIEEAKLCTVKVREIFLYKITYELFMAMTESAQTFLLYFRDYASVPKNIVQELKQLAKEGHIKSSSVEDYEQFFYLRRKIEKGVLSEITGRDIALYEKKARGFIDDIEKTIIILSLQKKEQFIRESYSHLMELCCRALKTQRKQLPGDDGKKIMLFKRLLVDTGKIDEVHYLILHNIYQHNKNKKTTLYVNQNDITNFEIALGKVRR
ncbi:nucleotidyltransferase domain-containing protein [Candidatus Woesearchaeota archaeon]|nr:nucleotidyltransferase domain-containing protein [Candidatus Woesearchaeota archaeon]